MSAWLVQRRSTIASQWYAGVFARLSSRQEPHAGLLERFLTLLTRTLPETLGPYRDEAEAIWLQIAELFGSVSAQRGLAAGEVIEEFQIVREVLVRLFYVDPPFDDGAPISLRDALHLNRMVDLGVTHASVGHTDALFFALFQGSGAPGPLDEETVAEVGAQLDGLEEELRDVQSSEDATGGTSGAEEGATPDAAARR